MIKLFTHTDLDGVGCTVLANLAFGVTNVNIEYCNYDDINHFVNEFIQKERKERKYDMVFITDISIEDELANTISSEFNNFYLLDHHSTALGLNDYSWCKVVIEETTGIKTSGTEMYYMWLVENGYLIKNQSVQKFAELVRDYDTWRWSTLGEAGFICKQVNDLLYLYGRDRFITWCISEIYDNVFPKLYASDELVLKIKQNEIDEYIKEKDKKMIMSSMGDYVCGFVFAEKYFSELGNKLCQMHPEIDFIAMIDIDGTVSYRTVKENIDLGKDVAKLFGGGGHPKAAGSQFSEEIKLNVIENIFS